MGYAAQVEQAYGLDCIEAIGTCHVQSKLPLYGKLHRL